MAEEAKSDSEALLARLRRIEGQVRGVHRMLAEGRVCEDILTQLMAARSGLDQVGLLIMDPHIEPPPPPGPPRGGGRPTPRGELRLWLRFGAPPPPAQQPP